MGRASKKWCFVCGADPKTNVEGADKEEYYLCDKCFVSNHEAEMKNHVRRNNLDL